MKKYKLILMIIFALAIISFAGCNNKTAEKQDSGINNTSSNTPDMDNFNPDNEASKVKESYNFAKDNQKLLRKFYCVCSCMVNNGHKGLDQCFIKNVDSKGKINWDGHGTFCIICQDQALDIKAWKKEGKSEKEIINLYKDKYGKEPGAPKNWDFK